MRRLLPLVLSFVMCVVVPERDAAQISDRDLAERIAEAIRNYPRYSVFDDVEIGVENRVVTLAGRVTSPIKKDEITRRVEKIDGIRSLTNEIGVLPVSRTDD